MIKAFLKPIAIMLASVMLAGVAFTASIHKKGEDTSIATEPKEEIEEDVEALKSTERP